MDRYYVTVTVTMGLSGNALAEKFDLLAEAVYDLTGVIDPDLAFDLAAGTADFSMGIDAETADEALRDVILAIRAAVHAAGAGTSGWEKAIEGLDRPRRSELVTA